MEKTRNSANVDPRTRRLAFCALFTALGVVLGGLLSIPAMPLGSYTLKIGLGVLPVIVTAVLYGPLYGGTVGALTDLLQALIFPKGAYMPWFTVIGGAFRVIPRYVLRKGSEAYAEAHIRSCVFRTDGLQCGAQYAAAHVALRVSVADRICEVNKSGGDDTAVYRPRVLRGKAYG